MNQGAFIREHVLSVLILIAVILLAGVEYSRWRVERQAASPRAAVETALPAKPAVDAPRVQRGAPPPVHDDFSAAEQSTIAIFKRVSPSVVAVANKTLMRDVFGFRLYEIPQGMGSGMIWDREGHILSNFHVIYEASSLQVTLRNGSNYTAAVVGVDPDHDLAVLKIKAPAEQLTPIPVGTSRDLQVGQSVLAIGNPFGFDTSLSVGIVSALGRTITSPSGETIHDVIQTDAAINPGNSGGPLLDSRGRLIGMNAAIVSPSGAFAGVGFAVPADTITHLVPLLIAHGRVLRIGLRITTLPDNMIAESDITGVPILAVQPHSAAAKAGLRGGRLTPDGDIILGDIIREIDGQAITSNDDLLNAMERHKAGDRVPVVIERDAGRQTVTVPLEPLN